jgi:hypothetical protein
MGEASEGQVAGKGVAGEATDDNFFVRGGHGVESRRPGVAPLGDCRMAQWRRNEKGAGEVVNTPMLCYTYVLCLRV